MGAGRGVRGERIDAIPHAPSRDDDGPGRRAQGAVDAGRGPGPQGPLEVADHEPGRHWDEPPQGRVQRRAVVAAVGVALEQVDGVVDQILDMGGVAHGQRGQLLDGHTLTHQGAGRHQHVDVVGPEALAVAVVLKWRQQPGVDHEIDDERRDTGTLGKPDSVERETGSGCVGCGIGRVGPVPHATMLRVGKAMPRSGAGLGAAPLTGGGPTRVGP